MLDFALRVGFEIRLCQPYRAQTKGKVESGVKYVKGNMWPSIRFTGDADLNRQGLEWCDMVSPTGGYMAPPAGYPGRCWPRSFLTWDLGRLPHRSTLASWTARWPGTASSVGRAPATGSTGSGPAASCRWASVREPYRSGPATSASRCIPGRSVRVGQSYSGDTRPRRRWVNSKLAIRENKKSVGQIAIGVFAQFFVGVDTSWDSASSAPRSGWSRPGRPGGRLSWQSRPPCGRMPGGADEGILR